MLVSGAIRVSPIDVKEYSTAMDFDLVTRLATKPADSRLRSVRVRMCCETPSSCRSSSPWRCVPFCRQDKISTVHLPMKIVEAPFELGSDLSSISSSLPTKSSLSATIARTAASPLDVPPKAPFFLLLVKAETKIFLKGPCRWEYDPASQ